jgi:Zn-dependent protease with chaperone function
MNYEQYTALIQELEKSAASNRRFYEFKIFLLTALGYGYFIGLILLLFIPIPLVGLLLWNSPEQVWRLLLFGAKLWWALIPGLAIYFGFIGAAVKAITAKVPDPEGTELTRSQAPKLFEFVDRTCAELKAKKPSKVLVTDSFNAAVATMPRFGIFGQKVFLLLGLPLMRALSPEQFEAVLAHEIGHISGKHGSFAKWAYQMREAWGRLIESQDETDHKLSSLYKKFVDWFFPYFSAYSFVMMREHEKDADREASKIVGSRPLGEALILLETKGRKLEDDFWREVHEENIASDKPTERMFTRMLDSLAFVGEEHAAQTLSKAVAIPTDYNDSHPALADRLKLMGYWTSGDLPILPGPVENDAATHFLGQETNAFVAEFDTSWDQQARQTWKERHDHFRESNERLSELEKKQASDEISLDDLREMAQRITEKDGIKAAAQVVEQAAEKFPDDGVALYNLGLLRLAQDDESGLSLLERAAELDRTLKYDVSQLSFEFLRGKGRLDEAKKYARDIEDQNVNFERANKERATVNLTDSFEPHDLPDEFLETIPRKLAGMEEIVSLYAAHKVVEHFPESPFRVLFIELRPKRRDDADGKTVFDIVVDRLSTGEFAYFALLDSSWWKVKNQLDQIQGARFYHKP